MSDTSRPTWSEAFAAVTGGDKWQQPRSSVSEGLGLSRISDFLIEQALKGARTEPNHINRSVEVTGKGSAFGRLTESLDLLQQELESYFPKDDQQHEHVDVPRASVPPLYTLSEGKNGNKILTLYADTIRSAQEHVTSVAPYSPESLQLISLSAAVGKQLDTPALGV